MFSLPPKKLQNTLIFYFTCIVVLTNGFFAVLTFSRENIALYNEAFQQAAFLARMIEPGAKEFIAGGSEYAMENVLRNRPGNMNHFFITLYDANWWRIWGDPSRLPPEGPPKFEDLNETALRSGVPGTTGKELFLAVASGAEVVGIIAVGIPKFSTFSLYTTFPQIFLTMLINISLGIILAVFIAQIILRPLRQVLEGLDAIKEGNYSSRIQVAFGEEMVMLGEMFNSMAAKIEEKVIETTERTRALDEKLQELWEIYELTKQMGFSLNLAEVLETFFQKARTLSLSSYGQVILYNPQTCETEVQVGTSSFPAIPRAQYDETLQDCLKQARTCEIQAGSHTMLFIPLLSGSQVQGSLFLGKHGNQLFSSGVKRFLETIAPLGGSLIENARLYHHVVEMKEYVRNILNSVDSGVATIDDDLCLVTWNFAFINLLEISATPVDKTHLRDILAEIDDRQFSDEFIEICSGSVSTISLTREYSEDGKDETLHHLGLEGGRGQLWLRRKSGGPKFFRIRVYPLLAGNTRIGKVVILDDQTALRKIERQMLENEKWTVLGRLAASVAHEIRNPLVAIRSLVELIGEDLENAESKNHVKVVIGEVQRLNKTVEELLALSKPETAMIKEVDLSMLLDETILLIRHEALRREIKIEKTCVREVECVRIDPEKMKQAFLNIMLNAIQAMEKSGILSIHVDCTNSQNENCSFTISFSDTGPGIDPKIAERIFDPFFTTREQGTGLGLAITKKIVELHDGRITVHSGPGGGGLVRIEIPMKRSIGGQQTDDRE